MIKRKPVGSVIIEAMVFIAVGTVILAGLVQWGLTLIKASQAASRTVVAQQVAEAGIEYYRWHLAHAAGDFQDGTGHAGPRETCPSAGFRAGWCGPSGSGRTRGRRRGLR